MCENKQTKHFLLIDQLFRVVDKLRFYLLRAYHAHYSVGIYASAYTKSEGFFPSYPPLLPYFPPFPPVLWCINHALCDIVTIYRQDKLNNETLAQLIQQLAAIGEQAAATETFELAATESLAQTILTLLQETLKKAQPEIQQELDKIYINREQAAAIETFELAVTETLAQTMPTLSQETLEDTQTEIQQEVDRSYINTVKGKPMGVEDGEGIDIQIIDGQIQSQVVVSPGEKLFIPKPAKKLPAGVSKLQGDFLREVQQSGVLQRFQEKNEKTKVNEKPTETAEMIYRYYGTEATYEDIAKDYPITYGAVKDRIMRGIKKMRRMLYETDPKFVLKDLYPLAQIQKGKPKTEVFKTDKSKMRRSEASSNAAKSEESIQKRREAGKKGGGTPKYKTEEERRRARLESYKRYNREKRSTKQGMQQSDVFIASPPKLK